MICIKEKDDSISYEMIVDVLHDAHSTTMENGMHFKAASQNVKETLDRLGDTGKFFCAIDDKDGLVGCGAVIKHTSSNMWWACNGEYRSIEMVAVKNDHKGQGINRMLYKEMEKYGFSDCPVMEMNTAVNNRIVIESNLRHNWVIAGYISWKGTNYYSVRMLKWRAGYPVSRGRIIIKKYSSWMRVHLIKNKNGKYRLLPGIIKMAIHR